MEQKSILIKYRDRLERIWRDPVWSKVIAALIAFLVSFVYSLINKYDGNILDAIRDAFFLELYLWQILTFFLVFSAATYFVIWYRNKKRLNSSPFNVEEQFGNFTFRELYNCMITYNVHVNPQYQSSSIGENSNLLDLWLTYHFSFNKGVYHENEVFEHYYLAPQFMTFGLVEKVHSKREDNILNIDDYQTSEIGYKFLAYLEKYRLHLESKKIKNDRNLDSSIPPLSDENVSKR